MGSGRRVPPGWPRFRLMIFDRDGYRCVDCGRPGRLEASHDLPVWKYPHLEMDETNVKARCRPCHLAFDRRPTPPATVAWRQLVRDMLK